MPFDNLKTQIWKIEKCQRWKHNLFLKNSCFSVFFYLISGSIFCLIFLKNESHEHHLCNVMYVEQILVKGITAAQ